MVVGNLKQVRLAGDIPYGQSRQVKLAADPGPDIQEAISSCPFTLGSASGNFSIGMVSSNANARDTTMIVECAAGANLRLENTRGKCLQVCARKREYCW